jgi:hypothetical protein
MNTAYNEISDNVDHNVFPDFEHVGLPFRLRQLVMGHFSVPDRDWIIDMHERRELPTRTLYGEGHDNDFDPHNSRYTFNASDDEFRPGHTRTEYLTRGYWQYIGDMTYVFGYNLDGVENRSQMILGRLRSLRKGLEVSRMPGDTTLKPEDEPRMQGETMLQWCFGILEVCRAMQKLCDWLFVTVIKAKNHPKKTYLSEKVLKDLQEESKLVFQAVRDVAESYITLLQRRGLQAFKAQVRWGVTGEALRVFLSDDDVEYYAKEYVESSLESWKGVLKVKLK